MRTTTLDPRITTTITATPDRGVSTVRVIRSEWIKLRTLRSTWWTLGAAMMAMLAIGLVVASVTSTSNWAKLDLEDTIASAPMQGYYLAELLIGVLGVLCVSGEYGTGMIRSTFTAVPKRVPVLRAKSVVCAAVALIVMTLTSLVTFFAAQVILSADGHGSSLSDPGALRSIAGMGVSMALIGLLGGAFGWIIRSTAGALSARVGLLLIAPVLVGLVPGSLSTTITEYSPSNAGASFVTSVHLPGTLGPWAGIGVLGLWAAVALAVATVVVRRRDA